MSTVGRERVLFLYLPTGGGHLSNSKAISQKIADRYGAETLVYDPVSAQSWFGRILLEDSYRFVSLRMPRFWNMIFKFNATNLVMTMSQSTTRFYGWQGLRNIINEWKPTKIVCLHHLLMPAIKAEMRGRPAMPVTVVATDPFVPPRLWAHGHEYPIICMSAEALQTFVEMGVPCEHLRAFSIIIGEKFNTRMSLADRAAFLSSIGVDPAKRFVLIAGGGDGMRGADRILEELCSSRLDYQVAVVCGHDETTRKRAEEVARRHGLAGRTVVVFGFTDKMYELMGSADAIVSKAGPAVLGEILASGKPNIIAFYIPGQEKANVRWVEEHGVGVYRPKPPEMREAVERILTDDAYRQEMERNIASIGFKNGLDDIARALME